MLFQDPSDESRELSEPRETTPIWGASRAGGDAISLEEASLLLGALRPEAVCRIGREVSRALASAHGSEPGVDGALSAARVMFDRLGHVRLTPSAGKLEEPRLVSPERRGTRLPAEPADDLYALGVLIAEAALGHPLEPQSRYLDVRIFDGALPERLVDAIAALVAPPGKRLKHATAALRMFADLEARFGDGARALGEALDRARLGAAFGGLGSSLEGGEDEEGPVTVPDPLPAAQAVLDLASGVDAAAAQFRAHEIAFFARGIVIAPLPTVPRPRRSRAHAAIALGALSGVAVVVALALFVPWQPLASTVEQRSRAWWSAVSESMKPVVVVPARAHAAPVDEPQVAAPAPVSVVVAAPPAIVEAAETPPEEKVEPKADANAEANTAPIERASTSTSVREPARKVEPIAPPAPKPAPVVAAKPAPERKAAPAAPKPAPVKKPAVVEKPAPVAAPVADEGPAVKLIVDASPQVRARAEAALRACAIDGPILGALHSKNKKLVKVSSDPSNSCVERVLLRTLPGYRQDEPFEIELR